MLCILTLGFLIRLFSGEFDLVGVSFISVTACSLLFNYSSMLIARDQKGVDPQSIMNLIKDRMEAALSSREMNGK